MTWSARKPSRKKARRASRGGERDPVLDPPLRSWRLQNLEKSVSWDAAIWSAVACHRFPLRFGYVRDDFPSSRVLKSGGDQACLGALTALHNMLALNTIHNGSCIEGFQQVAPGSVDLVFADPPFNIGYDYDVYHDERAADEYLDWTRKWIGGVKRVLKPNGTFWLAIGDEYAAELKLIANVTSALPAEVG